MQYSVYAEGAFYNNEMGIEREDLGRFKVVGFPFTLSESKTEIHKAPSRLGEHTEEILGELGYDDEMEAMKKNGVV